MFDNTGTSGVSAGYEKCTPELTESPSDKAVMSIVSEMEINLAATNPTFAAQLKERIDKW